MKRKLNLIGIIVIAAITGFAVTACGGDPCETGHDYDEWNTSANPSERKCKNCDDTEYCYCYDPSDPHYDRSNFSAWAQVGNTAASTRNCYTCGKEQTLSKEHFYGTWKHITETDNVQQIVISANEFHLTYPASPTVNYYKYTGTNLTWTANINTRSGKDTKTNEEISPALFPVGFALTGGTTTAGGNWGANTGACWVYMKTSGDAIIVRLTEALVTRIFTFTLE